MANGQLQHNLQHSIFIDVTRTIAIKIMSKIFSTWDVVSLIENFDIIRAMGNTWRYYFCMGMQTSMRKDK